MKTTSDIIAEHRRTGVHPCDIDGERRVSTASRWCEDLWLLDTPNRSLARTVISIDWTTMSEPLAPTFKTLFWSIFISRPDGQPYALSHASTLFSRVRYLAHWMERRKRHSLVSITPAFVDAYRSDLKTWLKDKSKDRETEVTTGSVVGYLKALEFAFQQRAALEAEGHKGLGFQPFGESSPWTVAEEIAPYVESFTPPIADALVIPIVSEAYRFIREVADDVIEIQSRLLALESRKVGKKTQRTISHKHFSTLRPKVIRDYAVERASGRPWLAEMCREGPIGDVADGQTAAFRRLMADVVAAAVIVVRFSTGIRHGEILTFAPGLDDDGLPLCVEAEKSISGAYELFFVKGVVSKGWDHPEDTRWLLAGRGNGDRNIPDAVRAIQVIERILSPWRERSTDPDSRKQLLLQFGIHGFPTNPAHILPMLSDQLAIVLKDFYERRVDWSGVDFTNPKVSKFAGPDIRKIQSKQWRKTWANFVIRTNRKLLPAISQQFQHFSTVLTQVAYIGKDAEQLGLVEDAATERAIEFMYDAFEGKPGVGGMARKAVDRLHDLKAKVRGIGDDEKRGAIRDWLTERDIKVWPAQHGKCVVGMMPEESRCHAAGRTSDWSNQTPNFLTRSARLCSGCACFAVDGDDVPFWADRYLRNKRIWRRPSNATWTSTTWSHATDTRLRNGSCARSPWTSTNSRGSMAVPIKTAPTPEERALVKEALARLLAGKPRIATLQKRVRRGSLQTNLNALTLESGVSRHRIEKLYPDLAQAADEARGKRGETIPLRKQLDTARRDKQAAERRLEQSQSVSYHLMHRIAAYRSEVQMLKDRVAELERGLGGGAMDDLFFGSDDIVGIPSMPAPKRTRGRGANSTA